MATTIIQKITFIRDQSSLSKPNIAISYQENKLYIRDEEILSMMGHQYRKLNIAHKIHVLQWITKQATYVHTYIQYKYPIR